MKSRHQSIIKLLPWNEGQQLIVCVSDKYEPSLLISIVIGDSSLTNIARLDCLKASVQSVFLGLSPVSSQPDEPILLLGTEDGHVYELTVRDKKLRLLCDIQQPVVSILGISSDLAIIGKFGKIVIRKSSGSGAVATLFAPTAIHNCSSSDRILFLQGDDQLYSAVLSSSPSDGPIEARYCQVKHVRSFRLCGEKQKALIILTENGALYQVSCGHFDGTGPQRCGSEVNGILQEIQRCADQTKVLNATSQRAKEDLEQLSTALAMLGGDHSDKFSFTVRSFPAGFDSEEERLRISITNQSSWSFPASHWGAVVTVNRSSTSARLNRTTWATGDVLQLDHRFSLPEEQDSRVGIEVKVSLFFRIADPFRDAEQQQPVCVFPICQTRLTILDFLELTAAPPSSLDERIFQDVLGFSCKKTDAPWQFLLNRSWHRGFNSLEVPPFGTELNLRYGKTSIRMILTEEQGPTEKLWILRLAATDPSNLLLLRAELFNLIRAQRPILENSSDAIQVPACLLAQCQVGFRHCSFL